MDILIELSSVSFINVELQEYGVLFPSERSGAYPEFMELYQEIAPFLTNPRELISMYSEVLAIADKNTVRLMLDEMNNHVNNLINEIAEKNKVLSEMDKALSEIEAENETLREHTE